MKLIFISICLKNYQSRNKKGRKYTGISQSGVKIYYFK